MICQAALWGLIEELVDGDQQVVHETPSGVAAVTQGRGERLLGVMLVGNAIL